MICPKDAKEIESIVAKAIAKIGLEVETTPRFETRHVWAEEAGALNANSAEWSFGNGATGFIGLPICEDGWEITQVSFHGDTYAAQTQVEIAVCDYAIAPSAAAANILTTISLANSTDGTGATNNATKCVEVDPPIAVNAGAILGFRTLQVTGTASDCRVQVRMRRQTGTHVTNVAIT